MLSESLHKVGISTFKINTLSLKRVPASFPLMSIWPTLSHFTGRKNSQITYITLIHLANFSLNNEQSKYSVVS